jgi:hypothetical protein
MNLQPLHRNGKYRLPPEILGNSGKATEEHVVTAMAQLHILKDIAEYAIHRE